MIELNTDMVSQQALNQPLAEHLKVNKSFLKATQTSRSVA